MLNEQTLEKETTSQIQLHLHNSLFAEDTLAAINRNLVEKEEEVRKPSIADIMRYRRRSIR